MGRIGKAGILGAVGTVLLATPASAEGIGDMFDVAFGVAAASDYVSRGVSWNGGEPTVQGYVEATYGLFYLGAWASGTSSNTDAEIDLWAGVRPETENAWFDLGYVHYFSAKDEWPSYGELYAIAEYYATDRFTLGGSVYFAPDYSQEGATATYVEATGDMALFGNIGASAGVGYQAFDSKLGLPDYATWNAGVYWSWDETVTLDLRYIDSDLSKGQCALLSSRHACGARFLATLSFDTAVSAFAN